MGDRYSVIIFPEGTRGRARKSCCFKSGLYYLCRAKPGIRLFRAYLESLNRTLPKGEYLPVPFVSRLNFGTAAQLQSLFTCSLYNHSYTCPVDRRRSLVRHHRSNGALRAALAAVFAISFSACGGTGNPPASGVRLSATQSLPAAESPFRAQTGARRAVGLGPVVKTALGGQIFGWDINENGNDGLLTEAVTEPSGGITSAVETFDQTTAKITKIVAKQRSKSGNHELVVAAIVANDVGLIDDERDQHHVRQDIFHLMAPVTGGKLTGLWTPPHDRNLLIESVADQQSNPLVPILAYINQIGGGPEVLVSDVANDTFKPTLKFPPHQIFSGYYIVAEDVTLQEAIVPVLTASSSTAFVVFNIANGKVTKFRGVNEESGAAEGIAIDSTTDTMCITTHDNYSVEFYNLKTHKGISEQLPGAVGQLEDGAAITADPVNHLFLVTQPVSSVSPSGGSTIYVYDENGTLDETINGFSFSNVSSAFFERVEVNATQRTGYVNGPSGNELQGFSY